MDKCPLPGVSALTLGTASLGMVYGVANPQAAPDRRQADALLDAAWQGGISWLDTAPAYGEAERRIGGWISATGHRPRLVTKMPSLKGVPDGEVAATVRAAAARSKALLGRIDGYLAHGAEDYGRGAVRDVLSALKSEGAVAATGLSAYEPEQVLAALETGAPDMVQVPLSLLDRRMATSGALAACSDAGVAVFARSLFLQGAILMAPERLPAHLEPLADTIRALRGLAAAAGTSVQGLALRWVRDREGVTSCVVGVYGPDQLDELLAAAAEPPLADETDAALAQIASGAPADCLDPRRWPR